MITPLGSSFQKGLLIVEVSFGLSRAQLIIQQDQDTQGYSAASASLNHDVSRICKELDGKRAGQTLPELTLLSLTIYKLESESRIASANPG
jgi:hypothetical protein